MAASAVESSKVLVRFILGLRVSGSGFAWILKMTDVGVGVKINESSGGSYSRIGSRGSGGFLDERRILVIGEKRLSLSLRLDLEGGRATMARFSYGISN